MKQFILFVVVCSMLNLFAGNYPKGKFNGVDSIQTPVLTNYDWLQILKEQAKDFKGAGNFYAYNDFVSGVKDRFKHDRRASGFTRISAYYEHNKKDDLFVACINNVAIFGNKLNFLVEEKDFYWQFNKKQPTMLLSIALDFGGGFEAIEIGQARTIDFGPSTSIDTIRMRIKVSDGKEEFYRYAAFKFIRKGTNSLVNGYPHEVKLHNVLRDSAEYKGMQYQGSAIVLMNPRNKTGKLQRPFITCDGFDHNDKIGLLESYMDHPTVNEQRSLMEMIAGDYHFEMEASGGEDSSSQTLAAFFDHGFDLVVVNFDRGTGDVIGNTQVMKQFMKRIDQEYRNEFTEEWTVLGPSMGGLITRLALTEFEQENYHFPVKHWISFDSPQKGANIPLPLQLTLRHWKDALPLPAAKHRANGGYHNVVNPAALQLLVESVESVDSKDMTHLDQVRHPMHLSFYQYVDSLGYPQSTAENLTVSNGNGAKLYEGNNRQIMDFGVTGLSFFRSRGWANNHKGQDYKRATVGFKKYYFKSEASFDQSSGGFFIALALVNKHPLNSKKGVSPSDLDFTYIESNDQYRSFAYHSFIPFASSLGLEVTSNNVGVANLDSLMDEIPFDKAIIAQKENEFHCHISEYTKNEVIAASNALMDTIQFPRRNNHEYIIDRPVAYYAKDLVSFGGHEKDKQILFKPNSKVTVTSGQEVVFKKGVHIQKGSSISVRLEDEIPFQNQETPSSSEITPFNHFWKPFDLRK